MTVRPSLAAALLCPLLLAGCASVSHDGLQADVQAAAQGRTAGVNGAALPSPDATAQADAHAAIQRWLAEPLTADSAVRIALLNNPGLQSRLAQLGVQDADRVRALTLPNPSFAIGGLTSHSEREIERTLSFGLIDLVTLPWRTRWQTQALQRSTLAAAQDVARLATDARSAWVRAVAAQQVLAAHERMHDAAEAGAELARRMTRVGNWSRLQQAREQAALADSRTQLAQARLAAATAREQLARMLGLWGDSARFTLAERLPDLPVQPLAADGLEARALRERLDVRAARLALDRVADQQGTSGIASVFGDIGLAYSRNTTTERPSTGQRDVQRGWELELPLPLFDWGGAASARARALTRQSAAELQHTALQARTDVRTRWLAYRTAWDVAHQQTTEVVPLRSFIQQETLLRYNGMLASVWDLLAEARASTGAVAQAVQAQRDFWLADAALQFAVTAASPGDAPATAQAASPSPTSAGQ
ncbi:MULTISPECIES: TolC family protein [unclassified Acidovorax]|uniref:TolC family protein n=1 Tax=unclassified Acidovorax TaxID=2684926 RepID=UPI0028832C92|nr:MULTISPECIES: TolC family protein [unclassified Acidovorax]